MSANSSSSKRRDRPIDPTGRLPALAGGLQQSPTRGYDLAYSTWPTVALAGPVLLMALAVAAHRLRRTGRLMPLAAIVAVGAIISLTVRPEWQRLAPYIGRATPLDLARALDPAIVIAAGFGLVAVGIAARILGGKRIARPDLQRARSDNHGHADWLDMKDARQLFPGPDPAHGGLVVGEAYRVDRDRVAHLPFEPDDPGTWGKGGIAPLLVDPCRSGPTHALVVAGSGGFKTTSIGVPTLLTWTASTVVLDPARELGPMVTGYREQALGQRVITLDPADADAGSFNVLDWIDVASPLAESNVEAVVGWICGEAGHGRSGHITSGAEFFKDGGKALIACLLADMLWDPDLEAEEKTLRRLRQALVTPDARMREVLTHIHAGSHSAMACDLAGTLMGLVAETFSGVYANADRDTRWLSTPAYAALVSGSTFRIGELAAGRLTVLVQVSLKTLQATPSLGRVIIGALLNAAYEADGKVQGRVLFLLDEVARFGPMAILEQARDAGRKYRLTLLLLYQSLGQLTEQWGKEGKQAWYDSTSWRLFAAVQDPDTAKELATICGEHGVVATSTGDSRGTQGRAGAGLPSSSSGKSRNRAEIKRALIKPDELLQDTRSDEAFILTRGRKPLRCGRALYFRRPDMQARVAQNRFHQTAASNAAVDVVPSRAGSHQPPANLAAIDPPSRGCAS